MFQKVSTIVSAAAKELGLVAADIADPFGSADPNIVQLVAFLDALGRELVLDHEWPQLRRTCTINTVNGQSTYQLPDDFERMIDQSGWNRTTRFPLVGPVSGQTWQYLKAIPSVSVLGLMFREAVPDAGAGGTPVRFVEVLPVPTSVVTVAFEYLCSTWVADSSLGPANPVISTKDDFPLFEARLLVCGIKLAWKSAKGFDVSAAQDAYDAALERAKSTIPAPNLSLNGSSGLSPFLSEKSIPFTGYGVP